MDEEVDRWNTLASLLGIRVVAPATLEIDGESISFTALLPQFVGKKGMVADPKWEAIDPHATSLMKVGFGFSTVSFGSHPDPESVKEMLRDWGWTASEPTPPWW